MVKLAIIGGTGLTSLQGAEITRREEVQTPYGAPSDALVYASLHGVPVVFLARHGHRHQIPPHRVNYRANIWALRQGGAERIFAAAAVGGIHSELVSGRIAIPQQIVDYTWSRASTFFEDDLEHVVHVDFTEPYCPELRGRMIRCARAAGLDAWERGTYGVTQGPRLETAAEIERMARDGCDMVGMTAMPEAGLARELELPYATCAMVVNAAAGRGEGPITMKDIEANLKGTVQKLRTLLQHLVAEL
ncbi:MAG: S-methyl-5'-thioinosine phosphorylase [Gammaproteobacteria bacterium]|nr:S-methyl-5'-thioinosine phosphorylase [Gammaproteobacteria bacterium]NIR83034.1 S-methyl-5'-thioinosine phosphorylase [Gammaproteobacteria bacterium]NIR90696.1 S-methyl-5'-thioinosine phosphorylase [Gammaproteobacteria bacterium]NIU04187.1 S-methyl-5'-thioinosine phosphorylase [Gammaproteobacteria bacterium]NIV51479.1 S-methyl-5'-thioinosine phosphorylase [Gammaproteobacteria bacterium]